MRPFGNVFVFGGKSESVRPLGEYVQLERNVAITQLFCKKQGVFDVYAGVLCGVPKKDGWRLLCDVLCQAKLLLAFLIAITKEVFSASHVTDALRNVNDGVGEDGAVGMAIELIDLVRLIVTAIAIGQ